LVGSEHAYKLAKRKRAGVHLQNAGHLGY
jgi:hypothetical protein